MTLFKFPILTAFTLSIFIISTVPVSAETMCLPPARPYLPTTQEEADEFDLLIAHDANTYYSEAESYLACLERERLRVILEVQEFSREYETYIEFLR